MARRGNPSLRLAQRAQAMHKTPKKGPRLPGFQGFEQRLQQVQQHLRAQQIEQALALVHPLQTRSVTTAQQHRQLGYLLSRYQQHPQAELSFNQAKLHQCQDPRIQETAHKTQKVLDYPLPEQQRQLEQAVRLCPTSPALWNHLGSVAKKNQQLDLARKAFTQAIDLQPDRFRAWYGLSTLIDFKQAPQHLESLQQQLKATLNHPASSASAASPKPASATPTQPRDPVVLALGWAALGKAFQDLNQPEHAFQAYQQAKNGLAQTQSAQLTLTAQRVKELKACFTPPATSPAAHTQHNHQPQPLATGHQSTPQATAQSIYLLGMPRSGKTLLEQQLSQHPHIQPGRESRTLIDWVRQNLPYRGRALHKWFTQLTPPEIERLQQQWQEHQTALPPATYLTQTHPWNLGYLGHLAQLDPQAPLIFITRNYLDLGLSIYFKIFKTQNTYALDLATIGQQIALYEALSQHWQHTLPNPQLQVSYESLVSQPQATLAQIYAFLELTPPNTATPPDTPCPAPVALPLGAAQSVDWMTPLRSDFTQLHHAYHEQLTPLQQSYQRTREQQT